MIEVSISEIEANETWDIRHRVMWPNMPYNFVKLENDFDGKHYGLFVNGKLTSIISLFINEYEAQFRKFATEISHQGKGYGTTLLEHVISEVKSMNINTLWCNARLDKTQYYEKFGLSKTKKTYVKGGIDFVILEKNI